MTGIAYADNNSSLNHWTGLYAGVNAGFIFNKTLLRSQQLGFTNLSEECNARSDFSTFTPGIQLGYMHQRPSYFVSGIEANLSFNTNRKDTLSCTCPNNPNVSDRLSFRNQMQGSIKGRIGHTLNWNKNLFLPYVTTGVSFANAGLTYKNEGGDYYSKNTTKTGWPIGAGIEWAFKQNWSLRAEYLYVSYGDALKLKIPSIYDLFDSNGNARIALNSNNIVIAINYWV